MTHEMEWTVQHFLYQVDLWITWKEDTQKSNLTGAIDMPTMELTY